MALCSALRFVRTDLTKVCVAQRARLLHAGRALQAADKSLLLQLRKTTGYSFSNCKKALERFSDDVKQAESWLHEQAQKEGWSKALRLEGRRAKEGLIGQLMGDRSAVMVEVNCETDFVARNEKFHGLVRDVALATMAHHRSRTGAQSGYLKTVLSADDLSKLSAREGASLADQVALAVGRLGENIALRRALVLGVPGEWNIGSYIHGALPGQTDVAMGRYGALVVFQSGQGEAEPMGRKLGQHIVGEAPLTLGNTEDLSCGDSETRLLPQSFLADPSKTVAQFLNEHGARVLDFVRFQCGEEDRDTKQ